MWASPSSSAAERLTSAPAVRAAGLDVGAARREREREELGREELGDGLAERLERREVEGALGALVEHDDAPGGVGDEDGVVRVIEDGREAGLHVALEATAGLTLEARLVLREGHLERDREHAIVEGLREVGGGIDATGAHERGLVDEGGEEDHRHGPALEHRCGDLDSVAPGPEVDVEEQEVRRVGEGELDGLVAGRDRAEDVVAEAEQAVLQVHGHHGLVFGDEDAAAGSRRGGCGNHGEGSEAGVAARPGVRHERANTRPTQKAEGGSAVKADMIATSRSVIPISGEGRGGLWASDRSGA
mgnify:CR=1 FL=1